MVKRLAGALLVCSTISAQASFFSGNELYGYCTLGERSFALGYVMGAADMEGLNMGAIDKHTGRNIAPKRFVCIPEHATGQQIVDLACKYLTDNPAQRQLPAPLLVYKAMLDAWRCTQ